MVFGLGALTGAQAQPVARGDALTLGTAPCLRDADPARLARRYSVVLERTVRELRGNSCLQLDEMAQARQQILRSRSFGTRIYDLSSLCEAVSHHVAHAAEALRRQGSLAGMLAVCLRTGMHEPDPSRYIGHQGLPLCPPTDDTRTLTATAARLAQRLYRPGYAYA